MNTKVVGAVAVAAVGLGLSAWALTGQLGGPSEIRSASARRDSSPTPEPETSHLGAERFVSADDPDALEQAQELGIEIPADAGSAGGPRRMVGPGGQPMGAMPAWMTPIEAPEAGWSFRRVSNADEAGQALDDYSAALEDEVTHNDDLGALGGASKLSIVESWRTFIRPIVSEDSAAFAGAVAALGGLATQATDGTLLEGPAAGLFNQLSGFLGGASIDWGASTTRKADPDNPMDVPGPPRLPGGMQFEGSAIPLMTMVMRDEGPNGTVERRAVSIPMHELFPSAAAASNNGAPVVEVWTPASISDGAGTAPDAGVGTFMVWDAAQRAWAPVAMRITIESDEARSAFDRVQRGDG